MNQVVFPNKGEPSGFTLFWRPELHQEALGPVNEILSQGGSRMTKVGQLDLRDRWPRLREFLKLVLNQYQNIKVGILRIVGAVDFPVPPNSNMRRTSARTIKEYYRSALTTYSPIVTMAQFYGVKFDPQTKILDFGCGVGRQLLPMTRHFPDAQYFAVDVDPSSVEFIRRNYPTVHANVNGFMPPLKFADREMDLVYAVSTFSHFDLPTQTAWLTELFRITKPGGIVLPTIEGKRALLSVARSTRNDKSEVEEKLRNDGIFYKEYVWLKELKKRGPALTAAVEMANYFGDSYGNTIMTTDFVRRNWPAAGFEVLGIAEGVVDARQDLVVLRRPVNS
jgi:ubiquinone/menaquinone biosynthesis C-methylase UbiE